MNSLGEFEEIVLLIVASQGSESYGLSITKIIEDEIKRPVTLSSVHTALYRLEEKRMVKSKIGGATTSRGGRRKRLFQITAEGKKALSSAKYTRQILYKMIPKGIL